MNDVSTVSAEIKAAIKSFGVSTKGTFDAWALMGDSWRFARQRLMSALSGKKVPMKDCGVTALRRKLLELCGWNPVDYPLCDAERDEFIKKWCVELVGVLQETAAGPIEVIDSAKGLNNGGSTIWIGKLLDGRYVVTGRFEYYVQTSVLEIAEAKFTELTGKAVS